MVYDWYLYENNSFIGLNSIIGDDIFFPHGIKGVFISNMAKIGHKCVVFHHVTIGSNTLIDSKNNGAPVIGDNVMIGAGASIIGNVTIGDNVRIGAGCIVTIDIPNNSVVVMNKPRIILKENINNKFLNWSELKKSKLIYHNQDT